MRILFTLYLYTVIVNAAITQLKRKNIDITANYYQKLISGDATTKLAELNMFITAMPKGADLHHHYLGAIYVEIYLDWLAKLNYCVYSIDNASLNIEKYTVATNVTRLCLTADQIRSDDDFYRQLLKHWSNLDYANHYHEQSPPDKQFFDALAYVTPIGTAANYSEGLLWLKNRAVDENVQYIETMFLQGPNFTLTNNLDAMINALTSQTNDVDLEAAFTVYFNAISKNSTVNEIINNYVTTIETAANQIDDANFTLRFLSYVTRSNTPVHVFTSLYSCFTAALRSNLIVGVNVEGAENGLVAVRDYTLHMKMFRFFKQQFPTERIGHSGRSVENNEHPLLAYKAFHVPIVIATDDAGLSRSTMSHEYLMYTDRYKPSYAEIKTLVYNSIRYSFLNETEKIQQLNNLDTRFRHFEQKIADITGIVSHAHSLFSNLSFKIIVLSFIILHY